MLISAAGTGSLSPALLSLFQIPDFIPMGATSEEIAADLCSAIFDCHSVTATLGNWCAARGLGGPALRSEVHARSGRLPLPMPGGAALDLGPGERVRHRAITLFCGDLPLLDADNWYLPDRLSARARRLLEETDTPFGTALEDASLGRVTTAARLPSKVLARLDATSLEIDDVRADAAVPLLIVRGVVSSEAGPVSFVEERFRPELIAAAQAALAPEDGNPRHGAARWGGKRKEQR